MFHYPFHINDYRSATLHLSNDEDLAYRRLLDLYYDTEKPIPVDVEWVAKRLRCKKSVVESVLKDMFYLEDDGWHSKRCDLEISKYQSFSVNGARGAAIRWNKKNDSESKGGNVGAIGGLQSANSNREPITENREPITENRGTSEDASSKSKKSKKQKAEPVVYPEPKRFDDFWNTWPSSQRKIKKVACREKWAEKNLDAIADKIISHVASLKSSKQWLEGFDPAPMTYLNQSRWEDAEPVKEFDPANPRAYFAHLYKPA